jgi:hypothetical protein
MNAQAVAFVLAPMYLVLGLSVLLYAKQYQKLFAKWADGHFDLFTLMFSMMAGGLVVISLYNVWEWNVWLLVTLSGWGMFLKGLFYFLCPEKCIKNALKMGQNVNLLYFGGVVGLVVGLVLGYYTFLV